MIKTPSKGKSAKSRRRMQRALIGTENEGFSSPREFVFHLDAQAPLSARVQNEFWARARQNYGVLGQAKAPLLPPKSVFGGSGVFV
jgi:hypothetical protein